MSCGSAQGIAETAEFDSVLKDCTCPDLFYIVEEKNNFGILTKKTCQPCAKAAYRGPKERTVNECEVCPVRGQMYDVTKDPYECSCSSNSPDGAFTTAGDICILDSVIAKRDYSPD